MNQVREIEWVCLANELSKAQPRLSGRVFEPLIRFSVLTAIGSAPPTSLAVYRVFSQQGATCSSEQNIWERIRVSRRLSLIRMGRALAVLNSVLLCFGLQEHPRFRRLRRTRLYRVLGSYNTSYYVAIVQEKEKKLRMELRPTDLGLRRDINLERIKRWSILRAAGSVWKWNQRRYHWSSRNIANLCKTRREVIGVFGDEACHAVPFLLLYWLMGHNVSLVL